MNLFIIDEHRKEILSKLQTLNFIKDFKLAGGTGLSLILGLRTSFDFDFFSQSHFNPTLLLNQIKEKFQKVEIMTIVDELSTLDLYIEGVKVSFFEYKYKLIGTPINFIEYPPMQILSLIDIAAMKLVAIVQRGTKKDFFDLYFLIKELNLAPLDIKKIILEKYNDENLFYNLILSIGYFDDADQQLLPKTFKEISFEEIKKFFINYQKKLTII